MSDRKSAGAVVPQAIALAANGEKVLTAPRPWPAGYGYWSVFELCSQLSASGFAAADSSSRQEWRPDVEPGSVDEHRQTLDGQMHAAQLAMLPLCAAQLVSLAPYKLEAVEQFADHEQAHTWAVSGALAFDPLYLDLSDPAQRQTAALSVAGEAWPVAGALLWCHEAGLSLVLFAAPPTEDGGPPYQPLAHVLIGRGPDLPAPAAGEVVIDVETGQSLTPLIESEDSMLNRRMFAALSLTTGMLAIARYVSASELRDADPDPRARARARERGQEAPLTVA